MSYIGEVFDNYYNISLEDRLILIEKLDKLYYDNMTNFTYEYSDALSIIEMTTKKMLQASKFEEFYNDLDNKEKKEFQKQLYEASYNTNNWPWYSISRSYDKIKKIYGLEYTPVEKREEFKIDFNKLDEEFNQCKGKEVEEVISTFCKKYYRYAIERLENTKLSPEEKEKLINKYSNPLISEFNEAMNKFTKVINKNVNTSTRKAFYSLSQEKQLYTIFQVLDIDKEKLDDMIEYHIKIKEARKQLSYRNLYMSDKNKQYVKKK